MKFPVHTSGPKQKRKYEGRTESHEQLFFRMQKKGTADEWVSSVKPTTPAGRRTHYKGTEAHPCPAADPKDQHTYKI